MNEKSGGLTVTSKLHINIECGRLFKDGMTCMVSSNREVYCRLVGGLLCENSSEDDKRMKPMGYCG